jgi:probable addiction module antidote protein
MTKTDKLKIAPFDASDYLDSEETIAEYLTAALENPDPDAFLVAVSDVAKARGMSKVAANAGLGRESLYKALKPGAQPRFDTVRRLLDALGVKLDVAASR